MTSIKVVETIKQLVLPRKALFGLIKWDEVVKTDSLGIELHIKTDCDKVYINGVEWKPQRGSR